MRQLHSELRIRTSGRGFYESTGEVHDSGWMFIRSRLDFSPVTWMLRGE